MTDSRLERVERVDARQEFFRDKAHGRKMIRVAWWIVNTGAPMSGQSVQAALAALGIDGIQPRNEREVHGIVAYLREALDEAGGRHREADAV
jgi:hypothetical protein